MGDFDVEPNFIPCLFLCTRQEPECHLREVLRFHGWCRRDFMLACPMAAASLIPCEVMLGPVGSTSFCGSCCLSPGGCSHAVCQLVLL